MYINFKDKNLNNAYIDYMNRKNKSAAENIEYIMEEIKRMTSVLKVIYPECDNLYKTTKNKVVTNKYASGGDLITRGYLCPSPIYDIVTGKCSRGRMINNLSKSKKISYEYGFDKKDNLIIANNLILDQHEFLLYDEDKVVLGIVFQYSTNQKCDILLINKCTYDEEGRIKSYIRGESFDNNSIDFLNIEKYNYDKLGLKEAYVSQATINDKLPIIDNTKYIFQHDKNGYLSYYTVEPYMFEDKKFKVYKKVKI